MKIPILMYHQICEEVSPGAPFRGLVVRPSAFRRQMALMHLLGYRGLSMGALMPYLQGKAQLLYPEPRDVFPVNLRT